MSNITPEAFAARLNGREYRNEITEDEAAEAKAAGLVVIFGASDDLLELRGAIDDEVGAYDGTTVRVSTDGLIPAWTEDYGISEEEAALHFKRKAAPHQAIKAIWCPTDLPGTSWGYATEIPHATFDVLEDGDVYCRGIVFRLADVGGHRKSTSETVDLLKRASAYIQASVRTVTGADGEPDPASDSDAAAHDLACALAHEASRLASVAFEVVLTDEETSFLRAFMGEDEGEAPSPIRLQIGDGHDGYGVYVSLVDYPEEGSSLLTTLAAQPPQAPPADHFVDANKMVEAPPAAPSFEQGKALPVAYLRSISHPDWLELCAESDAGAFPVFASQVAKVGP